METLAEEYAEDPIVTFVSLRLTRTPAVPSKVRRAFSSGAVVVTVTGSPPGTMGYVWVADPETVWTSVPAALVVVTWSATPPASVGENAPV
jgi:hypothetical protein